MLCNLFFSLVDKNKHFFCPEWSVPSSASNSKTGLLLFPERKKKESCRLPPFLQIVGKLLQILTEYLLHMHTMLRVLKDREKINTCSQRVFNSYQHNNKHLKQEWAILACIIKSWIVGTSLVVQWLRLHAPNAGGPGSIPGQGTRSHMPQWRSCVLQLRPGVAK